MNEKTNRTEVPHFFLYMLQTPVLLCPVDRCKLEILCNSCYAVPVTWSKFAQSLNACTSIQHVICFNFHSSGDLCCICKILVEGNKAYSRTQSLTLTNVMVMCVYSYVECLAGSTILLKLSVFSCMWCLVHAATYDSFILNLKTLV